MAGPAGLAQAATERFSVSGRPLNGRGATALAGLASTSLVVLFLLGALLHGGPFAGAPVHRGAASHATGQALTAALSQALGAGDSLYHARRLLGGYEARNPAQHLRARFTHDGVVFSSGSLHVALALRESGYGRAMRPVAVAAPRATANRVAYAHGSLTEWYENGPLGVEQGFTVARSPTRADGRLTLLIGTSGNARPRLRPGSGSVAFVHDGRGSLRYGGLFAIDARGHTLPSDLSVRGSTVLLRVDTRGAAYPLRVDPLVQQGEKLSGGATEGEAGLFGFAVALSSDGNTALVGAPHDRNEAGAAWIFVRSGPTWTQQGPKLAGAGEVGEGHFGRSVALSADGNTALIGGPADADHAGSAWVFERSGSTWRQQGTKLMGGEEAGAFAHFGRAVALSADGATALASAPNDGHGRGAVWVLEHVGGEWVQQGAKLSGGEIVGEAHLGGSVALSADGSTALVGGAGDDGRLGAAWAFVHGAGGWTQQGPKLTGSEEVGTSGGTCFEEASQGEEDAGGCGFGRSISLSADGNTALIGGPRDGDQIGAAWAFQRSGSSWTQQGPKLTAAGELGQSEFGYSTALSSDGNTALIGGPGDNTRVGAAWLFSRAGGTWTQQARKLNPRDEQGKAGFGYDVALSADAETALVGGPFERAKLGAAWAFVQGAEVENPLEEKRKEKGKKAKEESSASSTEAPPATPSAAPPGVGVLAFGASGASCRLARVSRNIAVLSRGRLTLKLLWNGRGRCSGRLALTAGVRRRGARPKALTIARATFSLTAGRSGLVRTRLNSRGRGLLGASHGRLSARLTVVTVVAGRARSSSASVRLSVAQKRGMRLIGH